MERSISFEIDKKCDFCGKQGAFDIMGNYMCIDCFEKYNKEESEERKMTIQEAIEELKKVYDYDTSSAHVMADDILLEFLRSNGFGELADLCQLPTTYRGGGL